MAIIPAAYPFIDVVVNTAGLTPIATRLTGVVAVVGKAQSGGNNVGSAPVNTPLEVSTLEDAAQFAGLDGGGAVTKRTSLYDSLVLAMQQNPPPQKIYGVKVDGDDYGAALATLESVGDVTFVTLANESGPGDAPPKAPTKLGALKDHVERVSAAGNKRIGVAMVDPAIAKSPTYAGDLDGAITAELKSSDGRMVVVAARGATMDVATAAAAAIAGYAPLVSLVLKPLNGVSIPSVSRYSPSEIKQLSELNIIPIISPALLPSGFYFGEGRTYSDGVLGYIDTVRVLDDIDFRLKAGLVGAIGDARITRFGLRQVATRIDGILQPLLSNQTIDGYSSAIPVLDILSIPESSWTPGQTNQVATARGNRTVDVFVSVLYGPAVHRLSISLNPSFV